jgi:hypothetical protein
MHLTLVAARKEAVSPFSPFCDIFLEILERMGVHMSHPSGKIIVPSHTTISCRNLAMLGIHPLLGLIQDAKKGL